LIARPSGASYIRAERRLRRSAPASRVALRHPAPVPTVPLLPERLTRAPPDPVAAAAPSSSCMERFGGGPPTSRLPPDPPTHATPPRSS
jgi:hypothetical protein